MSKVPKAVQRQAEAAEAAYKARYEEQQETDEALQEAGDEQETEQQVEAQEAEPVETAQQPEPVRDDWQNKYESLRGKYDAEVPRMAYQLREAKRQMDELKAELEALKSQPAAPEAIPQIDEYADRLREDYGDDFVQSVQAMARKIVADEMGSKVQPLMSEVTQIRQQDAQSKSERFWSDLDSKVSDWESLNADPKFLAWLGEYDPVAGMTRDDALKEAQRTLNSQRAAAIFQAFKGAAPAKQTSRRESVQRQVAPGRTRAAPPPAERPSYTPADFQRLQEEARQGLWRGREAEFTQREREIHEALFGSG